MSSVCCNVSLKMVVRVFLTIACFFKIAVCNPYASMLNNKFPTLTTSYATNILPEEYPGNIQYYDSYRPTIPQEISYPTEEIRLNYPSILSRPMAITPLPMPRDLSAEVFIPEGNFPNNGHAAGKSACHKNHNNDNAMPKLINDIPTPKFQFKPFSDSFNSFRENLFKSSELNLRSNAMVPQCLVFDDFGIADDRNYPMSDLDDILSPPLKIPLKPQVPYELPTQKPFYDYNFNTYQDSLNDLRNKRIENEIASPVYPGPSDIFSNQAISTLNDGKFLEGEIQFPGIPAYNNNNPFDSGLLNHQLLLLNNFAVPEKQSKRTTDLNNLSNFDIDINISDNTCNENTPIEITISDASDILISRDTGDAPYITIDICNENSDTYKYFPDQVQTSESDAPPCQLASEPEKVIDDAQNMNSIDSERFSLKEFSTYLAESILSALQMYAFQPISSNTKDNKNNGTLTCGYETAPSFNKSVSPCGPIVSSQPNTVPNIKTKSKDKIKSNKTSQTSPVFNNTEEKVKAPSNSNKIKDAPLNVTLKTSLPSNKDDKTSEPSLPACLCNISDKSKDITTDKSSLSSNIINKTSDVASDINTSPITNKCKDTSKDKSSLTSLTSSSINKTSEVASTINICPTTNKGKDNYIDTQIVKPSNNTNKSSEVISNQVKCKDIFTYKAPQNSLPSENKDRTSVGNVSIDKHPVSNKSKEISREEPIKTSMPPTNMDQSEATSTSTKTCPSCQAPLPQTDKVAEKPSVIKPQPCISTIKINISPLKDNLHQIVVFV